MLHVLLLILKITGIVIACILGLVILVVTAVLFVPVRYKVNADYHDRFKAQAKVSWLGILRLMISYDEELDIKAKAFFITVYNNNDENSKVSEQKKAKKKKEKKPEENIFSASDKDVEKLTEKEEKPQIKMAEAVNETKEDVQNVKEAVSEDESGNIQNRSFFNKVKDKCFVIYTKIKEIIKLIRDTVKKISGAADRLKEKVSKAKEFVTDDYEIEDIEKAIDDIMQSYEKEKLNERKFQILDLLETDLEVSNKKELEKELSDIIIRLAKIR